ncbi:ABC transporter ATP-binding protein [Pedobacter antarcticus 4BY]|uniref:ABC transporter ATP-binding protein n=2 Tax=Pedobacter antarcticus TaxID=34086 RepID=A0A081PG51_9SPHI|nr:ATP-binding cassette domain-containing protein [Pedobacter antarcticus]KEQ29674.1 ABC transporter ATP-binding protein [Pedobacter antarcticus 4BY]SFF45318.1 ABC-2 type transport system ATP-binding protein [Pedobacter antarcticus]
MLQAISLSKNYGTYLALNQLNLTVNPGEVYCLLGQNGAGKTTTINLFLGFIEPTDGKILINNQEVTASDERRRQYIAYIPEVVMLYGNLSAIENLNYFSKLAGFEYSHLQLISFLSECGLQSTAHEQQLSGFSKGMRQKVGIAIAVAKNAQIILMDEPTSGLDPKATAEFTILVKKLAADGRSILMATHDIFNAVALATHIGIMKQGELIHTLKAADITAADLQELYLQTI